MAIDQELPSIVSNKSSSSSSTSSSAVPFADRRRLVQVATTNSATFIQFPRSARQTSTFIPVDRSRTSQSTTRLSAYTAETQSLSNQSKSSENAPTPSIDSTEQKRSQSQQRTNPILTNPLLNHRKEQVKTPAMKSREYIRTTRLCLSSKPLRATADETEIPTIRASTAPIFAHQKETNHIDISDRIISINEDKTSSEYEQQMQYLDENKLDYITRWLKEVRAAIYSKEALLTKTKQHTKRRVVL